MNEKKKQERPDEWDRDAVLRVASWLMTGREDPHVVLPVADHLLAWLSADGLAGVESRKTALMQQWANIRHRDGSCGVTAFTDDPVGFLEAAAQYVPFLTGVTR